MSGGCTCSPCPGRGYDGHRMNHCAECCFGTFLEDDPGCSVHHSVFHTDHTTLPPTCSPRCNPGMHDLECQTPHVEPPLTKRARVNEHPGVGTLRPRSDEDGETDGRLADWRAAEVYGGRDVD